VLLLPFSKACEIEDFADPELAATLREVNAHRLDGLPTEFPAGREDRRDWEVAMALRSLRHFGAVTPASTLLGVAAAGSALAFHLSRHVRQVFAVDRYADLGPTPGTAMRRMTRPEDFAPLLVDANRLVVQHMDPRRLRYPDATFDGVFCGRASGLRGLEEVAHACFEMGRVLKPGGVLSIALGLRLAGPSGATGVPGDLVLSEGHLDRFVVAASGLARVDEARLRPSRRTLETRRQLAFSTPGGPARTTTRRPAAGYPCLVAVQDGYVSTSAHLTLQKTERYPCVPNAWAEPPLTTGGITGPGGPAEVRR
jgi:SAM-dependent methyltransferase